MFSKQIIYIILFFSYLNANIHITLDYPGWTREDFSVPGIPSKELDEYKNELLTWSDGRGNYLTSEDIDKYISKSFVLNTTVKNISINVNNQEENLLNEDYPLSDAIRDIIFLEEFQIKVKKWYSNYILLLGKEDIEFKDIFIQAEKIFKQYNEYVGESSFSDNNNNPLLNVFIGTGNSSYGNIIISDGLVESFSESLMSEFVMGSVSEQSLYHGLKSVKTTLKDINTWRDFGIDLSYNLGMNYLESSGIISDSSKLAIDNIFSASSALASGGVGLIFAPASMYYANFSYIMGKYSTDSTGAYFTFYYYFMKNYKDKKDKFLNNDGSLFHWRKLTENASEYTTICYQYTKNDFVGTILCNDMNYKLFGGIYLGTIDEERRTAVSIANLFMLVELLDIANLKNNLVKRIFLEKTKDLKPDFSFSKYEPRIQLISDGIAYIDSTDFINISSNSITVTANSNNNIIFSKEYISSYPEVFKYKSKPFKLILDDGSEVNAIYDSLINGLKFSHNTNSSFKIVKLKYPTSVSYNTVPFPSKIEKLILDILRDNIGIVKKTGQEVSYTNNDDGYFQKGEKPNYSRDDTNGIVLDHITKLMWQDNNIISKTINQSDSYCTGLTIGKYNGWRLPTIHEMQTLYDSQYNQVFKNKSTTQYITSTRYDQNSDHRWFIYLNKYRSYTTGYNSSGNVRCVRNMED